MSHPAEMESESETSPGIRWPAWVIFGGVVLCFAFAARYLWIEPSTMGLACGAIPLPAWCKIRELAIHVHEANGWGLAALAGGFIGVLFRWRWAVALGLSAGLLGLVLYNTGLAAVGLLLAMLRLIRP